MKTKPVQQHRTVAANHPVLSRPIRTFLLFASAFSLAAPLTAAPAPAPPVSCCGGGTDERIRARGVDLNGVAARPGLAARNGLALQRALASIRAAKSTSQAVSRFGKLKTAKAKIIERGGRNIVAVPMQNRKRTYLVRPLNGKIPRIVQFRKQGGKTTFAVLSSAGRRLASVPIPGATAGVDYDDYTNCVLFCASVFSQGEAGLKECIKGCTSIDSNFTAR